MNSKDEIIVLREIKYRDYDKILHVFSRGKGKIQIISKNCRKPNNKMFSISQLFNYSKVELYKSKDLYILNEGELISSFYNLRNDYDTFLFSGYILELLNYIINEDDVVPEIFEMTLVFLENIQKKDYEKETLISAYEVKISAFLGFTPRLSSCTYCNSRNNLNFFSREHGGLVCDNCSHDNSERISYSQINEIRKLLYLKFNQLSDYTISDKSKKIIHGYLVYHIDKKDFKSLSMIGKKIYE